MNVLLGFEKRKAFEFGFTDTPRVMRGLLWHTGKDLQGHVSFERDNVKVRDCIINNVYIYEAASIEELKSALQPTWIQIDNYIYLKLSDLYMGYNFADSLGAPWTKRYKLISVVLGTTNGDFIVIDNIAYKTGVVKGYKFKLSVDSMTEYNKIKFNSLSMSVLYNVIREVTNGIIGSFVWVTIRDTNQIIDKQLIENYNVDMNVVKISARDPRASMSDNVIDQKFISGEFKSPTYAGSNINNNVTESDVLNKWKGDAIGYCRGVVGECYNGYSANKDAYRYYRFSYGTFSVENVTPSGGGAARPNVEMEYDSGWRLLNTNEYAWVDYNETLPSGIIMTTLLLRVSAAIAHPVKEGTSVIDYDTSARRARITGVFKGFTDPYNIIKYLFERYSYQLFTSKYFNLQEMQAELAPLNAYPIGICFNKQTKFYDAIGQLQNGNVLGFKLCLFESLFTVRLHNPDRPVRFTLKSSDIKNLYQLNPDMEGLSYVSDAHVRYSRIYSDDDLFSDYTNQEIRDEIKYLHLADKSGNVESLLKDRSAARLRYLNYVAFSRAYCPSIDKIQLNELDVTKWMTLREFDIIEFDFSFWYPALAGMKFWYVTSMELDIRTDNVTINIRRKP
jgi:hypothetical protein